jgi:tRNA A37 threonylcarbamoyladenosine synthetase subunit TsaC/SUA5/YrdC
MADTIAKKTIPAPGAHPNVKADAHRIFDVLKGGGLALVPAEAGYALIASSTEAFQRSFAAKKRAPSHTQGIVGTIGLSRNLHVLPDETHDMIRVLHKDMNLSLGVIAPFRKDHAVLQHLSPMTLANVTKPDGTVAMYIGGSALLLELGRISDGAGELILGSSANITGSGQKFRLEDMEHEILEAADIIVDYGLQRYHVYGGRASSIIDFANMKTVRVGSSYELIRERIHKFWGIELPPDPDYPLEMR